MLLAVHEENVEEQELAEPAIASAPATPVPEAQPERIADPVLPLHLSVREQQAAKRIEEPVQELAEPAIPALEASASKGQLELVGLSELASVLGSAIAIGSSVDTNSREDGAEEEREPAPAELEPAAPWPPVLPQWHALQLEAAPAAVALLAAPLRPLAGTAPEPEPVAAAAMPSVELTALPLADAPANPIPIAVPVPVPAVTGKPESESAFSRPAPALPLAPLQDYTASASRQIRAGRRRLRIFSRRTPVRV